MSPAKIASQAGQGGKAWLARRVLTRLGQGAGRPIQAAEFGEREGAGERAVDAGCRRRPQRVERRGRQIEIEQRPGETDPRRGGGGIARRRAGEEVARRLRPPGVPRLDGAAQFAAGRFQAQGQGQVARGKEWRDVQGPLHRVLRFHDQLLDRRRARHDDGLLPRQQIDRAEGIGDEDDALQDRDARGAVGADADVDLGAANRRRHGRRLDLDIRRAVLVEKPETPFLERIA